MATKRDIATERRLIREAQMGNLESRKELHRVFKGLVDGVVYKTYQTPSGKQPVEAIRLEAERLLDKYIDTCNPDAMTQPSTYLTNAISKKLMRYVNNNSFNRTVENVNDHMDKFQTVRDDLAKTFKRPATDLEIATHMNTRYPTFNFTTKQVSRFRDNSRKLTFGSNIISSDGDGGISVADIQFSSPDVDPMGDLVTDLKIKELKTFIDSMPEPKRSILKHHEGLFGYPKLSQRQIAVKFGLNKYNVEKNIKEGKDDITQWMM